MPVIPIDDPHDPRLARYADLRTGDTARLDRDLFVVEGRWCVEQLAARDQMIQSVVVQSGRENVVAAWLNDATPIYSLSKESIQQLVGYDFHRGILACGRRPEIGSLDELTFDPGRPPIGLAVFGVSQRDNLGSMIRTATALGINRLLLGPKTADPYSRRAIRVSMATIFQQQLYQLPEPVTQLRELGRLRHVRTIVTTLDRDAMALDQFVPDDRPMILVVGNEADGVGAEIEAVATDRVTIPMQLGTDSLNVSIAAAIILYQLARCWQR